MARVDKKSLQRGDDPVAAERCAEPGDARIRIRAVRRRRHQHAQIGRRSPYPLVEPLARRCRCARTRRADARAQRSAADSAASKVAGATRRCCRSQRIATESTAGECGARSYSKRATHRAPPPSAARSIRRRSIAPRCPGRDSRAASPPRRRSGRAACRGARACVPRTSKMSAKSASMSKVSETRTSVRL